MSSAPSGPNRSFQSRLNRVAEKHAPLEAEKTDVQVLPDWKENFKYPAALVGAALLGMVAVFVARYARFHVMGSSLTGEDADITMMIDGAIGAGCSFLLFSMLKFEGAEFKAAQTLGIVGMITIMHNFVHAAPTPFKMLFSDQWTEEVIAATEPKSILFRGVSFVLIEEEESKPAIPTVRRAGKA